MPSAYARENDERKPLLGSGRNSSSVNTEASRARANAGTSHDGDAESTVATSSFSCRQCLGSYTPIEPLLFAYTFARVVVVVLTGFYFYDQASHKYGDPSMDSLNPCGNTSGGHRDMKKAEDVQKEALQLGMIGAFSNFLTAVIPTIFLGPATDKLGRRVGFVLPLLGTVMRAVVFLIVLGTNASVYFIYIGTVLEGLGGGFGAFLMTSFSTAADVSPPGKKRALRICIIEAVQVLGSALAGFIAGQWRRYSYIYPVMTAAAVGAATFIYALCVWTETLKSSTSTTSTRDSSPSSPGLSESNRNSVGARHLLPFKGDAVGSLPGRDRSAGQRSVHGRGHGTGTTGNIRINEDESERGVTSDARSDKFAQSGATAASATSLEKDRAEIQPSSTSYVSFSPTGHRLSTQSRHQGSLTRQTSTRRTENGEDDIEEEEEEEKAQGAVRPRSASDTSDCASCCISGLSNVRRSWNVYFRSDASSHPCRRSILGLCFFCFLLTVAVNFSKPGVETVFRLGELCWNAVSETKFDSAWLVQHWIFILITFRVLQHWFHVQDVYVAMIGCVSALCAPLIFSIATLPDMSMYTANVLVFVSAGSGTLARALIPMLRAMSSAVVDVDEQGALFTSYACVELAGAAVFDMAATQVYNATVHLWKGIIFVIMTFFFVIVFILLIILSVVQRRARRLREYNERATPHVQNYGGTEDRRPSSQQ